MATNSAWADRLAATARRLQWSLNGGVGVSSTNEERNGPSHIPRRSDSTADFSTAFQSHIATANNHSPFIDTGNTSFRISWDSTVSIPQGHSFGPLEPGDVHYVQSSSTLTTSEFYPSTKPEEPSNDYLLWKPIETDEPREEKFTESPLRSMSDIVERYLSRYEGYLRRSALDIILYGRDSYRLDGTPYPVPISFNTETEPTSPSITSNSGRRNPTNGQRVPNSEEPV